MLELAERRSSAGGSIARQAARSIGSANGVARLFQPSTFLKTIWPAASSAQNELCAEVGDGVNR
jgi:hypothetical protein